MNKPIEPNSFRTGPDEQGMFGIFGGRFVAETLMPLILELERHWNEAKTDPEFQAELKGLSTFYAGRPSKLYFAEGLTRHLGDEGRVILGPQVLYLEIADQRHQRLGDEAAAENAEVAALVGTAAEGVELGVLRLVCRRRHDDPLRPSRMRGRRQVVCLTVFAA